MGEGIPAGAGHYVFPDPRKDVAREIVVHTYRPAAFSAGSPILLVIHGRKRNGGEYRDFWIAEAERRGVLVVAPEFSDAQYPHPHEYNWGAMNRVDGSITSRDEWLFPAIEAVFQDAHSRARSSRGRYFLFGHSAGAQVVHRHATFAWSPSIERVVSANAGSYTMPVRGEEFPFGLGGVPLTDAELRTFFSRPMVVLLGDRDNDPHDEQLPREPGAMQQGPHRFARGHRYMEVARREADRIGVALAWRLAIAPGVAHSGKDMAPFAARELFG
jgi:poly(3-hydroxybutyrate) depolymerase